MLLLQLTTAIDTLLVRPIPPVRTPFEQVVFVASGLTSILALLLVVVLIVMLFALRAKAEETRRKLDVLIEDLRPIARNASAVSDKVRASVDTLTDRVDEMSAIIGRVNASAERVASVASTAVAGIKLGARALGLGKGRKKKGRKDLPERPRLRRRD